MQIKVSIPFPLTTTYHCLSFLFSHFLSLNTDKNNWPPTHVLWSYQYMETKKKRGGGGEETRELIKWPDVPLLEGKILDIPERTHTQIPTHTYMLVSMSRGWQVDFHNDWSRWCSVIYLSCWTGNPSVSVMFLAAPAFLSLVRSLTGLFFLCSSWGLLTSRTRFTPGPGVVFADMLGCNTSSRFRWTYNKADFWKSRLGILRNFHLKRP